MMQIEKKTLLLIFSLILAVFTLAVFDQVRDFDFVHYDDDTYVAANRQVRSGLTAASVAWAFTATDAGFWHPLTWLSLMCDYEIYRLNPGGYHGTNLIWHLFNTLLLFFILAALTDAPGKSAFVAGLFALHPLHVESVAWIAERKDVLSTFFWLLTTGAYAAYAKRPALSRYGIVMLFFSLGLMAKPMLVTLPLVLLLLDFWPLGRVRGWQEKGMACFSQAPHAAPAEIKPRTIGYLLLEKAPLLLLALPVAALVFHTESRVGALASLEAFPLATRISHALVSYWLYLGKTFWPIHLAIFYPHPGPWPLFIVGAALVGLLFITYVCLEFRSRFPYAAVGWFGYLGVMAPVSGLVQLGSQGMADRYTYLPLIGIFIMIAWGVPDILARWRGKKTVLPLAAVAILALMAGMAWQQAGYWRNAVTLFRHALKVTKGNYLAHNNLGAALAREDKFDAALIQYEAALRLRPQYVDALFNMGEALATKGKPAEAERYYRDALRLKPSFAEAHNNLAIILAQEGKTVEAVRHFEAALDIRPDYETAKQNLRLLLRKQEKEVTQDQQ